MGLLTSILFGTKKRRRTTSARKGNAFGSQKASASKLPDIEIPKGEHEIEVEGVKWCAIPLSNNNDRIFSLTPRNEYQENSDWPEQGVVNVNKNGSRRTTAKNWVGYIPARKAKRLLRTVLTHGTTRVHARVSVNGDDKKVTLLLPKESI